MSTPGRHCPLHYRTDPAALAGRTDVVAETVYVIGGMYGNTAALDAVLRLAAAEAEQGRPAPTLVFNGDFNWFNVDDQTFDRINTEVLRHLALQGNVEAELGSPEGEAGCGCAYPEWVDDATVARSNAIMQRLQGAATRTPGHAEAVSRLPRQMVADVGGVRTGIIHGDPESLAGWGLAVENMPAPGETPAVIADWFRRAQVDVFACSHTCLPFIQRFPVDGRARMVINNGSAGMPNFRGDRRGVVTRIGSTPCPEENRLYGAELNGVFCDAMAVPWASEAWDAWFRRTWPSGSPAAASYADRLQHGPMHGFRDAWRIDSGDVPA